jgi:hypothetical protein
MKQGRRKRLAKAWVAFQEKHGLSDGDVRLARQAGYSLERIERELADPPSGSASSVAERIGEIHCRWQERLAAREAAIEAGWVEPPKKKKKKKPKAAAHGPMWAKAKQLCRLNAEDVRKAKELGLTPRSLLKNIPGPSQRWKAPVKVWIRDLYEQRRERSKRKQRPARQSGETTRAAQVDHESVVEDWKRNAERNDEENYRFLRSMKFRNYGFEPDELAGELHKEAFQVVECTRCANCCKTMRPGLDEEDVDRIAGHLDMSADRFIATYLRLDPEDKRYAMRQVPCPFLGDDDRCKIYDVRPADCREYPHTDKEDLVSRTMGVANNTLVCPAAFWIVERMKRQALGDRGSR